MDQVAQLARHFIAGQWLASDDGSEADSLNPANGAVVGRYATGSAVEVDAAVAAARETFEAGGWQASPRRRAAALYAMADALEANRAQVADLAVAESGKLPGEIGHEIAAGISELRYYAGLARAIFGRVQEVEEGQLSIYAREPAGVVGIIVPWNAPITLLVRSLAPALAAGCTTVIKPAPQTSLTNALLMSLWSRIEALPAGAVNAVNERGAEVGQALVAHRDVDVISFTGSARTGKKIMAAAADSLKRLSLELGGKSPSILYSDADMAAAVPVIARCATVMAGQMCTAISRVLVHESRAEEAEAALTATLGGLKVGAPSDSATQMGPLVDIASRERIAGWVDRAADEADLLLRGSALGGDLSNGAYITPSLVRVADLDSPFVQDELFGPILTVERFSDDAEAVSRANGTRHGLAASIWTNDRVRAQRVSRALRFGTVWMNAHNRLFAEAETGGYKESGFGRLHGLEGLNDFLETKHVFGEAPWLRADGA